MAGVWRVRQLEKKDKQDAARKRASRMNDCPRTKESLRRSRGETERGGRGRDWNAGGGQHHVPVVNTQPRGEGRKRSRNSNCAIVMGWLKARV